MMTFIFLGRKLGTCSGIDMDEEFILVHEFKSLDDRLPSGDVIFNYVHGTAIMYTSGGMISMEIDLIPILASITPMTRVEIEKYMRGLR